MASNTERRITSAKIEATKIYQALEEHQDDWPSSLAMAREVMRIINSTTLMARPGRVEEQVWLIKGLQRLAYHDVDTGGIRDVADWCLIQWLRVLKNHPENVETLRGSRVIIYV